MTAAAAETHAAHGQSRNARRRFHSLWLQQDAVLRPYNPQLPNIVSELRGKSPPAPTAVPLRQLSRVPCLSLCCSCVGSGTFMGASPVHGTQAATSRRVNANCSAIPVVAAYRLPPLRLGLFGLSTGASGHLTGCLTPQLFHRPRQHPSQPNPAPQDRDTRSVSPEPRPGGPTVWCWAESELKPLTTY